MKPGFQISLSSTLRILTVSSVLATATLVIADPGKTITEPLGGLTEPLAFALDFKTFNPAKGRTTDQQLDEVLSLFDEFLAAQGIAPEATSTNLEKLTALIRRDLELSTRREADLDEQYDDLKDDLRVLRNRFKRGRNEKDLAAYLQAHERADSVKDQRDRLRSYLDFEEPLLARMTSATGAPVAGRRNAEAIDLAVRNLYSLFADQYLDQVGHDPSELSPKEMLQIVHQFAGRAGLNATPFHRPGTRGRPVGPLQAAAEATNLVDPASPDAFVPAARLASLSHDEISRLDVAPTNPAWHTHARMEAGPIDTWSEIEKWVEASVSAELLESGAFRHQFPHFRYRLEAGRRVLFWEDVKTTATSPKIDTRDALGQKWKLKWGEEAAVEPVAHRLRLLLGAKFADLNYTDVGGSSHLLILPSALEKALNPDKAMPLTRGEFVEVMRESTYEFNAEPFILSSGVITGPADEILAALPREALESYRKSDLTGRTWIRFRESMVEAKHDVIPDGGPVSTHCAFVTGDRAMRQAMIVAFWLGHTDLKEDNFRAVWIEGFGGRPDPQYLEFFHDPGSAFGAGKRSGELNRFNHGFGNGDFLWLDPGGHTVYSDFFCLYRPGHFAHVTFADQLSGARHIARLTRADIARAVAASEMPDFYQACLTWRLTKRRDLIAEVYGTPLRDAAAGEAPAFAIPLTTRAERSAAARHYRIPLEEIENDLIRTGHLRPGHRDGATKAPFLDVIVKEGVIQPYAASVITGILRDYRHPSGFVDRMTRYDDHAQWQSRRFKRK